MNKRKLIRVKSKETFITYEHFAKTYLLAAKLLLEVKKSDVKRHGNEQQRIDSGLIYIPIIYLIRHSIELILKSVDIGNSKSYLQSHDLVDLQNELDNFDIEISSPLKTHLLEVINKYMTYGLNTDLFRNVDIQNDVFRFPDNSTKTKIKGQNLALIDAEDLLQDVMFLSSACVTLFARWQIQKQMCPELRI